MIKKIRKWFIDQNNIVRKTAGLKEKEEAVKRKLEVALSILNDKRQMNIPVDIDRRKLATS